VFQVPEYGRIGGRNCYLLCKPKLKTFTGLANGIIGTLRSYETCTTSNSTDMAYVDSDTLVRPDSEGSAHELKGRKQPVPGVQRAKVSDLVIESSSVERILRRTPLVAIGEYRCGMDHPQFRGGGPMTCPYIVFGRSSVRFIPNRGPPEVFTPATVNLLDVGDSYERLPVAKEGADFDWIAISPSLLRDIAQITDRDIADRSASVFDRLVLPVSQRIFLAQQVFFSAIRRQPDVSQLAVEEALLALVSDVLRETLGIARAQDPIGVDKAPRKNAHRAREIVEATKINLASDYASNQSIVDLAARVYCSPGYLSRSFSKLTGFTLHDYQQQLRMRRSLQLICEARYNGAGIAAQLGYANHSHFTDVFRRMFRITPSEFLKTISAPSLRNMHAVLDEARTLQEKPCSGVFPELQASRIDN